MNEAELTGNQVFLERSFLSRHRGNPWIFGDPDGARADLSDFIEIRELRQSTYFSSDQRRVRIVIGRKGSGKTLQLRKLRTDILEDHALVLASGPVPPVVAQGEQTQLLTTRHVLKVAHWYPETYLTEIWQQCWGRAIVLAAASQLVFNKAFRQHVPSEDREALRADFSTLLMGTKEARTPFTTIKQLIDTSRSARSLSKRLDLPLWDDLSSRVGQLLASCPPLYFILDTVDEDYAHAPGYWLRCQKGLFYETMRLLRNSRLGSRLHVITSIRDTVFYSVFRSEHASRYVGDPHIQALDWGYNAARAFLDAKIERVPERVFPRGRRPKGLIEWLGFDSVRNSLGEVESVYDYVLRHTQCLPRDVVAFGNLLGDAMDEAHAVGDPFTPSRFREVVADVSRLSGLTQIGVVANQVVADEIPAEATHYGFEDAYLSVAEYREDRAERVIRIIGKCEFLRMDRQAFLELQAAGQREFGAPDLASVLWQAGLLGIEGVDNRAIFFSFDRLGRLRVPSKEERYVFHPSMREVAGLKPRGAPVYWRS